MSARPPSEARARDLLTAACVRERALMMLAEGLAGRLEPFDVRLDRLDDVAAYVAETIRINYPTLQVPPHARWRHFVIGGVDRWTALSQSLGVDAAERARIRFDLAVTSVLLDAGAGPRWRWRDPSTGTDIARSEGLAIASLDAFARGLFSGDRSRSLRADAAGLQALTPERLAVAFQASESNPLDGLDGRVALLNRLGRVAAGDPATFGAEGRVGRLLDRIVSHADGRAVAAPSLLAVLLDALAPIWPGRLTLDGTALGDTWRHPAIVVPGPTNGLVPLHKLSQWLAYSLIEPLEEAGYTVTDRDGLTGLAEYRNGGLFIDMGVIVPRDEMLLRTPLAPGDTAIVAWRALTVALLDRLAPMVRTRLRVTAAALPLAAILEGGTWAAGRRIARAKRADGRPPLTIISDGSVF